MADVERSEGEDKLGDSIIEIMARYKLGQIKREDMSEDNQAILRYYLGLMEEDSGFRQKVISRKNEIFETSLKGRKIPLYTAEELAKAKRHRKKKPTTYEHAYQPGLFGDPEQEKEIIGFDDILDPEKKLGKVHQELQGRFTSGSSSLVSEEMQYKRTKLRNLIGLPIARGKDRHTNDDFYKYLVKRIVKFDTFGIFLEFDRVLSDCPAELETKIDQVRGVLTEILNDNLNLRQKYQKLNQFTQEYKDRWDV